MGYSDIGSYFCERRYMDAKCLFVIDIDGVEIKRDYAFVIF